MVFEWSYGAVALRWSHKDGLAQTFTLTSESQRWLLMLRFALRGGSAPWWPWGQSLPAASPLRYGWKGAFVRVWQVWPFPLLHTHVPPTPRPPTSPKKLQLFGALFEMPGLSMAKKEKEIGNLNEFLCLITAQRHTESHLVFPNEMWRSHARVQRSIVRARGGNIHPSFPPLVASDIVNHTQMSMGWISLLWYLNARLLLLLLLLLLWSNSFLPPNTFIFNFTVK